MTVLLTLAALLALPLLPACAHRAPGPEVSGEQEPRTVVSGTAVPDAPQAGYERKIDKRLKEFDDRIQSLRDREDKLPNDARAELGALRRLREEASRRREALDSSVQNWDEAKSAMDKVLRDMDQSYSVIRSRMVTPAAGGPVTGY